MRRQCELRRTAPIPDRGFVLLVDRGGDERVDPKPRGARDEREAAVEKYVAAVPGENVPLIARLLEKLRDLARPVERTRRPWQRSRELGPAVEDRVEDVVVLDFEDGEVPVQRLAAIETLRIELHRALQRGDRIAAPSLGVPSDPMQEKQDVHPRRIVRRKGPGDSPGPESHPSAWSRGLLLPARAAPAGRRTGPAARGRCARRSRRRPRPRRAARRLRRPGRHSPAERTEAWSASFLSKNQSEPHRLHDGGRGRVHAELAVGVLDVRRCRMRGHAQLTRGLRVGEPARELAQHIDFPCGQANFFFHDTLPFARTETKSPERSRGPGFRRAGAIALAGPRVRTRSVLAENPAISNAAVRLQWLHLLYHSKRARILLAHPDQSQYPIHGQTPCRALR